MESLTEILSKREEHKIFYEDQLVIGIIPKKSVNESHLVILPKKNVKTLDELDSETFLQMNYVATHCSTIIFQGLNMHGTNIIIYDGDNSNNDYDVPSINIIGRLNDDNLNFKWDAKKEENLKEIAAKIKDHTFLIGKEKPKEEAKEKPQNEVKEEKGSVNYMIRQLFHMP
ncbi:HIT domain-containing protein [Candidatus Woesearchaeota archaeon]|nr:HIT domain-containing protein [Candidatus Woesearchaeota archaeon]